jgi:hypothetical protein
MKARTPQVLLATFIIALLAASSAAAQPSAGPMGLHIAYGADPKTSMTVMFLLPSGMEDTAWSAGAPVVIQFGTSASLGEQLPVFERPAPYAQPWIPYAVALTGLQPGTTYHYRVGSDVAGWSSIETFKTAPAAPEPFTVTVWGDQGPGQYATMPSTDTSEKAADKVVAQALKVAPDLHIHPGDLSYDDWDGWHRTVEPLAKNVPFMVSLGNHDGDEERELRQYEARMVMPTPPGVHYYGFTYGNVRFVSLDTEAWCVLRASTSNPYAGAHYGCTPEPNEAQLEFIRKEFQAARDDPSIDFLVPFFHKPIVSDGRHGPTQGLVKWWLPLLDEFKPELVLQAHDHLYERSHPVVNFSVDPLGSVYLVSGGAGKSLYAFRNATPPAWEAARSASYHLVSLRFDGQVINGTAIGADGAVLDTFQVSSLRSRMANATPPETPHVSSPVPGVVWAGLVLALSAVLSRRGTRKAHM